MPFIDALVPSSCPRLNRMELARMTETSLADVDEIITNYDNMETIFR